MARQVRAARPGAQIPRKPGRAETAAEAAIAPHAATLERKELRELTELRRVNARLLTALRKLGGTARADERIELLREIERRLAQKRACEAQLVPMLDMAEHAAILDELRDLDAAIDRQISELDDSPPDRPEFTRAAHVLHGEIEQQIDREREALIPAWADIEPPEG